MKCLFTLLYCVLVFCTTAYGSPLDAPGEKKITVRSEIERGYDTASYALSKAPLDNNAVAMAIIDARNRQVQANKDSDGFCLGYDYRGWEIVSGHIFDYRGGKSQFAEDIAVSYFKRFRFQQEKMGISDEDFLSVFFKPSDNQNKERAKERISNWEKQHPKQ